MRRNGLKSCERQEGIYGRLFVNRAGVERVNAARHQARVNGGKSSAAVRRAKKQESIPVGDETARTPVIFQGDIKPILGPATYKA
jgi:hypothetical protein